MLLYVCLRAVEINPFPVKTELLNESELDCVGVTSASLLSHSSSRAVEVFDTSRRFLGASISEKNDKADNVGDTENPPQGEWREHMGVFNTTGPMQT